MMKKIFNTLIVLLLMTGPSLLFGQIKTNGTGGGNWSSPSTWLGGLPNGTQVVTIQASDTLYFDVPVTISDSIICYSGKVSAFDSSQVVFGSGGVYNHAANAGKLPKATWNQGSVCLITGVIDTMPSNANQNFYDLTWNCAGQNTNLNLGMASPVIGGDIRIVNSNGSYVRLTAGNITVPGGRKVITINGNIFVDSSSCAFTATGSGSPNDTFSVVLKGNILSKGNFQLANGSGGTVNWFVAGNVTALEGSFTTNSTATKPDSLYFNGTEKQAFVRGGAVTSANIHYAVVNGAVVDFDTSNTGSSAGATFDLHAGGTVISGHPLGVNGNITVAGAVTLDSDADYVFDGADAQVTGTLMPATVNNLTIDNAAGVALTQATTINGVLALKAGVFDNTVPFMLGPSGSVSIEGGSLLVTSVKDPNDNGIPQKFFVNQNYPNPFNPTTTIAFGLPRQAFVTVKIFNILGQDVATAFSGELSAGVHNVQFDASRLSSGIYLYRVQADRSTEVKRMMLIK